MKDNLRLVTVATPAYAAMAEVIRSILEDGGFEAYITSPNAPTMGLAPCVLVQVEASQAEAAKRFLEENADGVTLEEQTE